MNKNSITKTSINGEEFININKQIEFLKKQGYIIENEKKIKHIITNYGYFRLFHNYINHWIDKDKQLLFPITEKNLLDAYYFDSNFSTLLYQYFGYFEHKLRSNIIAQGNIECPDITKQLSHFFPNKRYQKSIKAGINKHIYQGAKYLIPFKKLDFYPLFIIISFFDLGSTLNVMNYFQQKEIILNNFYMKNEKYFYFICNYLLRPFRNATAHFDIIYSFNIELYENLQQEFNEILKELLITEENYNIVVKNNQFYKNNTFIIVLLICYFLGKKQSLHLISELRKLFEKEWEYKIEYFNFYKDFLTNKDIMGWPEQWDQILISVIKNK